jgi:hypothetical protein
MHQGKRSSGGTELWDDFARQHHGNAFLEQNPLYALPEGLIDALLREVPDFWTGPEAASERDLARAAGGGFFYRRPFPSPLGPGRDGAGHPGLGDTIRTLLAGELRSDGRTDVQVRGYFREEDEQRAAAELRAAAYTAWLVTCPRFRAERDRLRRARGPHVAAAGRFPTLRLSVFGERPAPPPACEAEFLDFYRRWGLETFWTWELPVPLRPQTSAVTYQDTPSLGEAGLHLFLPWYLLRDGRLRLRVLARRHLTARHPAHLQGWLAPGGAGPRGLGYTRLRHLLVLFCGWRLALRGRHAGRLRRRTDALDRAFAAHLGLDPDSVKKLRLRMARLTPGP